MQQHEPLSRRNQQPSAKPVQVTIGAMATPNEPPARDSWCATVGSDLRLNGAISEQAPCPLLVVAANDKHAGLPSLWRFTMDIVRGAPLRGILTICVQTP